MHLEVQLDEGCGVCPLERGWRCLALDLRCPENGVHGNCPLALGGTVTVTSAPHPTMAPVAEPPPDNTLLVGLGTSSSEDDGPGMTTVLAGTRDASDFNSPSHHRMPRYHVYVTHGRRVGTAACSSAIFIHEDDTVDADSVLPSEQCRSKACRAAFARLNEGPDGE